jgi:cytochrome c556
MKKQNKAKLGLNKETIKALDPAKLHAVVGGAYTAAGTMCESCTYKSARVKCIILPE